MEDGVVLMYIKDGVMYPVGMTDEEMSMLNIVCKMFQPIKVDFKHPQGNAINLRGDKNDNS